MTDSTSNTGSPATPSSADQRSDEPMVVYEFAVPAEELAFADVLGEFEQLIPTNHTPLPYFWATDETAPAFRKGIAEDPHVDRVQRAATFEGGNLYGVTWTEDSDGLLGWAEGNHERTAVLGATGQADEWVLKLRFQTRAHLAGFRTFCDERGIDQRVIRLYDMTAPKLGEYDLSEKQREALIRALAMGHFEIPRQATLEDVAESLGISARATSERLRRGQTSLVKNTLTIGPSDTAGFDAS
ncbi:helix-turn-helix domain-containing protein [Haloarcula marina]|uniref:helix-turn-helix domain-containing protein n=1 Tax=Haloarcula marina TaxID=2961574 RepID=UPI0020B67E60|nr:helix-turn-helix domain-containing protein [Halomicroarcula marina]